MDADSIDVAAIAVEFQARVRSLFEDDLVLAFIFGGFGKGYGGAGHDIDMFILVTSPPEDLEPFRRWYFDLHDRYGLPPDPEHPGEVVLLSDLLARLTLLERSRIRSEIETQYEYEAILWADALMERKQGLTYGATAPLGQGDAVIARAEALGRRWRSEIRYLRDESPEVLASLDLRRLFKGYVRYRKGPGVPRLPNPSGIDYTGSVRGDRGQIFPSA